MTRLVLSLTVARSLALEPAGLQSDIVWQMLLWHLAVKPYQLVHVDS